MTLRVRQYSLSDLRRGITIDFVVSLLNLVMLTFLIWEFDYIEGAYNRVVLNFLPSVHSLMVFYQSVHRKHEARRFDWSSAPLFLLIALILLVAISDAYDLDELGVNVVVILASAPWLFIFWMLARAKGILAIGMAPAAVLLLVYWALPRLSDGLELHYALIPLPVVSTLLASWTLLVWVLFKGVDRWPKHPTLGPLMESLAMLSLFAPLMVLVIWVPRTISGGEDWSVVLAAMVGVVFGSVISEPLGRFLRSYGDLPSHRRCRHGEERGESQEGNTGRSR